MSARTRRPIHVLLVDDSTLARKLIGAVLKHAGMTVTIAEDGLIALQKMAVDRPDVIVLDLMLPHLDGMEFLRRTRGRRAVPVVVCSNTIADGSDAGLLALEEGAMALIAKPRVTSRGLMVGDAAQELVTAVEQAAGARATRVSRAKTSAGERTRRAPHPSLIAMGASTGGTEALRVVLGAMPSDAPPIVVVQHMPERFTAAFAKRLAAVCLVDVREATNGEPLVAGRALISPGDHHMRVVRTSKGLHVETTKGPPLNAHRPSVDVLFASVAEAVGRSAVGVLMTGMGNDGAAGLLAMKRAGATTIAQNRATSVVFGMPDAAIKLGAVDDVLPLHLIGLAILGRDAEPPASGTVATPIRLPRRETQSHAHVTARR